MCFDKPCSKFGPAFGFVMKPETQALACPVVLGRRPSKQPWCMQGLPNLILARHSYCTELHSKFEVDSADISCSYGEGQIRTAIWRHLDAGVFLRV